MVPDSIFRRPSQRGFSLVEIMVGMVIGMLGIISMMQVFSLAEGQKRATTGGGDAQNAGAIALYGLQRDIRQAGYATSELRLIGCNVLLRTGVTLNVMAPLTINHASVPAGDSNTDTLLVVYGNTNGTTQGDGIIAASAAANIYPVQTPTSHNANDYVVAVPQVRPTPCNLNLMQVASSYVGASNNSSLTLASNDPDLTTNLASLRNGTLYNLGQSPKVLAYAIRSNNLTVCDYLVNNCSAAGSTTDSTIWLPIASNIVSLRAQYGHDATTPMDGIVDLYDQTTPTTACGWVKTSAVRLVLVARNGLYEKTAVTTAAPTWAGTTAGNPSGSASTPIVLTSNANWQNYRYQIFQTVVPMRNVTWLGVQAGC